MKKMVKNTPEALKEMVANLQAALEISEDCSGWDCSECPLCLKNDEEDPQYGTHNCGWYLLKSTTLKILGK